MERYCKSVAEASKMCPSLCLSLVATCLPSLTIGNMHQGFSLFFFFYLLCMEERKAHFGSCWSKAKGLALKNKETHTTWWMQKAGNEGKCENTSHCVSHVLTFPRGSVYTFSLTVVFQRMKKHRRHWWYLKSFSHSIKYHLPNPEA